MIERIRGWLAPTEARAENYTEVLIAAQLAAASGFATARNTATFQSCLNLIAASASIAELSGEHSNRCGRSWALSCGRWWTPAKASG